MRVAICAALLALAAAALAAYFAREPVYAFDGLNYGVRAQLDAGVPYSQALARARAVYRDTPAAHHGNARRWLNSPVPQWWNLFRIRVLYPWTASLLWRAEGFGSLFTVSLAAYVLAALLTYGWLLRCTRPEFAALIALAIAVLPQSRVPARSDLTDMTAYALLIAALWSMSVYARSGRRRDLAVAAVSCALLSFTRPVPYMIVCAAAPLLFSPMRRRGAVLTTLGAALCGVVAIGMYLAHADVPVTPHFALAALTTLRTAAEWWYTHPAAWLALWALWIKRREPEALIALGAWASILPTILLDPIPGDVARVAILPGFASFGCGLAYATQFLTRAYRATTAARLCAHPDRNMPPRADRRWSGIRTNVS